MQPRWTRLHRLSIRNSAGAPVITCGADAGIRHFSPRHSSMRPGCVLIDQLQPPRCENRAHFFGIAARLMRLVLVDCARVRRAAKRGGAAECVTLEEVKLLSPGRAPDVLEVSEALEQLAMVDERKAKVIELRYFGAWIAKRSRSRWLSRFPP